MEFGFYACAIVTANGIKLNKLFFFLSLISAMTVTNSARDVKKKDALFQELILENIDCEQKYALAILAILLLANRYVLQGRGGGVGRRRLP